MYGAIQMQLNETHQNHTTDTNTVQCCYDRGDNRPSIDYVSEGHVAQHTTAYIPNARVPACGVVAVHFP